jgi:hypothetical protein
MSLVDPASGAYLPLESLREKFRAAGALDGCRAVTYCGLLQCTQPLEHGAGTR